MALIVVMLFSLLAVTGLAVDIGQLVMTRGHLQAVADATALAAVPEVPSQGNAAAVAQQYAQWMDSSHGQLVHPTDVVVGHWDGMGVFTPGGQPENAVRVVARRSTQNGNPVPTFFGPFLGSLFKNVSAWATATTGTAANSFTRFLVDDEMFDTDEQWLKDFAGTIPTSNYDSLLTDNDGDWFIDLPPGLSVEVSTGQSGDEALFDINNPEWVFTQTSSPSHEDFLNYNEDGSWRENLVPKWMLDPLRGVTRVNDPLKYPSYLSPNNCQVSPLYKSDISALNPIYPNIPAVNGLGYRRGLVAFTVDSIGSDPDGPSGSRLPNLWITICDPAIILGPGLGSVAVGPVSSSQLRLVQ